MLYDHNFLFVKDLSVSKQKTHLKLQTDEGSICKHGGKSSISLDNGKISSNRYKNYLDMLLEEDTNFRTTNY